MGAMSNSGLAADQALAVGADEALGQVLDPKSRLMDEAGVASPQVWKAAQNAMASTAAMSQLPVFENDGPTEAARDARFDALLARN